MNKDREFDLRTLEAYLRKGLISEKDYHSYLKSLSDEQGNVEFIEIEDDEKSEGSLTFS
ncbi:MAG: hypothetical protein ABH859_06395 [Pseudomonadota bacterium]